MLFFPVGDGLCYSLASRWGPYVTMFSGLLASPHVASFQI